MITVHRMYQRKKNFIYYKCYSNLSCALKHMDSFWSAKLRKNLSVTFSLDIEVMSTDIGISTGEFWCWLNHGYPVQKFKLFIGHLFCGSRIQRPCCRERTLSNHSAATIGSCTDAKTMLVEIVCLEWISKITVANVHWCGKLDSR